MNLLSNALRQIGSQDVSYFKFKGRAVNQLGFDISEYELPVIIKTGVVQPIKKEKYQLLGLDLAKECIRWWVPQDVLDVNRDVSGDQIVFNNYRWNVQGRTSWVIQNGWVSVICIKLDKEEVFKYG